MAPGSPEASLEGNPAETSNSATTHTTGDDSANSSTAITSTTSSGTTSSSTGSGPSSSRSTGILQRNAKNAAGRLAGAKRTSDTITGSCRNGRAC